MNEEVLVKNTPRKAAMNAARNVSRKAAGMILMVILVMCLSAVIARPGEVHAAKHFTIKASYANSEHTAIKLKWKPAHKMKAFQLQLYSRDDIDLLKSVKLSKNKRSYTIRGLKKDEFYTVHLFGYSKKSAKAKSRIARSKYTITTGVSHVVQDWVNDEWGLGNNNTYVHQYWSTRDTDFGIKADGIQIYRKVNNGDWEKLITFSRKRKKESKKYGVYIYNDKDIEFGNIYTYKARAYAKVKKNGKTKTIFSVFSYPDDCKIYNEEPVFTTDIDDIKTESETASSATLVSTADKLNFDFTFHFGEGGTKAYFNGDLWTQGYADIEEDKRWEEKIAPDCPVFIVTGYKLDDGMWQEAKGDVTLSKGESISLKFEGETEKDTADTTRWVDFMIPGCIYNESVTWGHIILTNGYNGCTINDDALEAARKNK